MFCNQNIYSIIFIKTLIRQHNKTFTLYKSIEQFPQNEKKFEKTKDLSPFCVAGLDQDSLEDVSSREYSRTSTYSQVQIDKKIDR